MDERLMYRNEFYVDGSWVAPAGTEHLDIVSPSSEQAVWGVPVATNEDIDRAVAPDWAGTSDPRGSRPTWKRKPSLTHRRSPTPFPRGEYIRSIGMLTRW
jgi:hypothetical protein